MLDRAAAPRHRARTRSVGPNAFLRGEGGGAPDHAHGRSRDNKRYLDRKNKKQREERKAEDIKRVRTLVGAMAAPGRNRTDGGALRVLTSAQTSGCVRRRDGRYGAGAGPAHAAHQGRRKGAQGPREGDQAGRRRKAWLARHGGRIVRQWRWGRRQKGLHRWRHTASPP